jgi:predicted TIM-barrel fold metal-dependent hydrolase
MATFQSDKIGVKLIGELGADHVMWGNDYPHPDGIWPHSQVMLADQLAPLSEEDKHKVVYANAARLYRFDQSQPN